MTDVETESQRQGAKSDGYGRPTVAAGVVGLDLEAEDLVLAGRFGTD